MSIATTAALVRSLHHTQYTQYTYLATTTFQPFMYPLSFSITGLCQLHAL